MVSEWPVCRSTWETQVGVGGFEKEKEKKDTELGLDGKVEIDQRGAGK